jgi:hypothetical protein
VIVVVDANGGQTHYGIGPQVAGDHHGNNYFQTIDSGTKSLLQKMAKTAPKFAEVVEKATREGLMSPSAVAALERAVESVNWDVADALLRASRNINEDVANSFDSISCELKGTKDGIDSSLVSMRDMLNELKSVQANIGRRAQTLTELPAPAVPTTPPKGQLDTFWFRCKVLLAGMGVGLVAALMLTSHHLGVWEFPGAVLTLGIPATTVLNWYLDRPRKSQWPPESRGASRVPRA